MLRESRRQVLERRRFPLARVRRNKLLCLLMINWTSLATVGTSVSRGQINEEKSASRRSSAGSRTGAVVDPGPSLLPQKPEVICSHCDSQKRVSPIPHSVEPEDPMDWDSYLGRDRKQRHFLNPWDPKYEPLLIFL